MLTGVLFDIKICRTKIAAIKEAHYNDAHACIDILAAFLVSSLL